MTVGQGKANAVRRALGDIGNVVGAKDGQAEYVEDLCMSKSDLHLYKFCGSYISSSMQTPESGKKGVYACCRQACLQVLIFLSIHHGWNSRVT